jgi:hypothetical protein
MVGYAQNLVFLFLRDVLIGLKESLLTVQRWIVVLLS